MLSKLFLNQRVLAILVLGMGGSVAYLSRRTPVKSDDGLAEAKRVLKSQGGRRDSAPPNISPIYVTTDAIDSPSKGFQAVSTVEQAPNFDGSENSQAKIYYPKTFSEAFASHPMTPSIARDYVPSSEPLQPYQARVETSFKPTVPSVSNAESNVTLSPKMTWPDQNYTYQPAQPPRISTPSLDTSMAAPRFVTNQSIASAPTAASLSSLSNSVVPPSEPAMPTTAPTLQAPPERIQTHVIRQPLRPR
jgi:hypothetical protein